MKRLLLNNINLIPNKEVTAEYLNREYVHIYNLKYNYDKDVYALWSRLQHFVVDLCLYLRTHDIEVKEVLISLNLYDSYAPVMLQLVLLPLPLNQWVTITAIHHKSEIFNNHIPETPVPWYNVIGYDKCFPRGASELVDAIHHRMGFYECRVCRYADSHVEYCGMGVEMYRNGCTSLLIGDHPKAKK